jgi:hypothetical protein
MGFMDYLKKGWEVVQLKVDAIDQLAADQKAFGPAIGILAIGGVCGAIGTFNLPGVVMYPVMRIIAYFVFIGIIHFAATSFFGGKGDFKATFTPPAIASFVSWVAIVPFVGTFIAGLAGLWMLAVTVVTVERVYGLDRGKAITAVAIPVVLGIVLAMIFAAAIGFGALMLMGTHR